MLSVEARAGTRCSAMRPPSTSLTSSWAAIAKRLSRGYVVCRMGKGRVEYRKSVGERKSANCDSNLYPNFPTLLSRMAEVNIWAVTEGDRRPRNVTVGHGHKVFDLDDLF